MLNKSLMQLVIFSVIVFSFTLFGCAEAETNDARSAQTATTTQEVASSTNTESNTDSDSKNSDDNDKETGSKESTDTSTKTSTKDTETDELSDAECMNASGDLVEKCNAKYSAMIQKDPTLCDNPTGIMALMCSNSTQVSQTMSGSNSGQSFNPCISLPPGDKERCEESFKQNPNSRPDPEKDPNYGKADPNARLATDEVDYTNVYVETYDRDNLPKMASYNFSELDKYSRMSKIRSAVGHDFSYNTPEYDATHSNCKSMKHYFVPTGVPLQNSAYATAPHTFEWMSIKFFAPVDGRIVGVYHTETQYGKEANFTIASSEYPGYFFMFFHVALDPDLKENSIVKAGQLVGTLGSEEAWGEIATSIKIGPKDHRLVSFLEVATDEVVQEYKSRGFVTASDVIVTKEQRDANPLQCDNSEAGWFIGSAASGVEDVPFTTWVFESTDNWFFLN